jgi:hypothetical protein
MGGWFRHSTSTCMVVESGVRTGSYKNAPISNTAPWDLVSGFVH